MENHKRVLAYTLSKKVNHNDLRKISGGSANNQLTLSPTVYLTNFDPRTKDTIGDGPFDF